MAEYIEREILLKKNFYTENCNSEENRWNDYAIKDIIMHIPAADVVPVVHCKNCEYNNECSVQDFGEMHQNDFCSRGKRRSDNG